MHEHGLARDLFPEFQRAARLHHFSRVTRVVLDIGMLHGADADFLAHSFEHIFEGTIFEGAEVEIHILEPGQDLPDTDGKATGRELVIRSLTGE
jgi:Zn finger protein HypA/HybF involved in hydrogenase expression